MLVIDSSSANLECPKVRNKKGKVQVIRQNSQNINKKGDFSFRKSKYLPEIPKLLNNWLVTVVWIVNANNSGHIREKAGAVQDSLQYCGD